MDQQSKFFAEASKGAGPAPELPKPIADLEEFQKRQRRVTITWVVLFGLGTAAVLAGVHLIGGLIGLVWILASLQALYDWASPESETSTRGRCVLRGLIAVVPVVVVIGLVGLVLVLLSMK